MQVQVQTDNHIENREPLIEHVEGVVRDAVDRHAERVTSVEVHLGDVNSGARAGPDDMRCLLEARIAGRKPIAVEHRAESLHLAIEGAADKLTSALESLLGRLDDRERKAQGAGQASAQTLADAGGVPPPIATDTPAGDSPSPQDTGHGSTRDRSNTTD